MKNNVKTSPRLINLVGKRFGQWLVLEHIPASHPDHVSGCNTCWRCRCIGCSRTFVVTAPNLTSGRSKACRSCSQQTLPKGEASFNGLYHNYKRGAVSRGLLFALSKAEFRELTKTDCHYCGAAPTRMWNRGFTNGHYAYTGVDRKDSAVGYVSGNCVSCCWDCNKRKGITPYDEFIEWVNRIARRHPRPV